MKLFNYIHQLRQCKDRILGVEQLIRKNQQILSLSQMTMNCQTEGITHDFIGEAPFIVSLTTYGTRLQRVFLTIESLMHQTIKPNKIVLSLSEEYKDRIPEMLKHQQRRGLEILFCKDIRSYTKLIPALKKYPSAAIITVDDDMLYPSDFLEYLVKSYIANPSNVYFYYGHTICLDGNGRPKSYDEWVKHPAIGSSMLNLPTGVDGVLYPPNCFHNDVTREELFMELCPYADDLWFKAMTALKDVASEHVPRLCNPREEFLPSTPDGIETLANINRVQRQNDIQANRLFDKYQLHQYLTKS